MKFGSNNRLTEIGSNIQENSPAKAQVVSHDHFLTFSIGA
jgi:hypothetical protein